jgi:hypothetical protein
MPISTPPITVRITAAQRGLPGDPRSANYTSILPLSALRAVRNTPDGLVYAEPDNLGGFVGITTTSGPGSINVVNENFLTDPSWAWNIGPIYVAPNGVLTQQEQPITREVAKAISPTVIFVHEGLVIDHG